MMRWVRMGAGAIVGFGERTLQMASEVLLDSLHFLEESDAIIDDPRLISTELLERRAAQGKAISFALEHPILTGQGIYTELSHFAEQGIAAAVGAYNRQQYFDAGRAFGQSVVEPTLLLAGSAQLGKTLVVSAAKTAKSSGNIIKKFAKTHEFKSPILFQYDSAAFGIGITFKEVNKFPDRLLISCAKDLNKPREVINHSGPYAPNRTLPAIHGVGVPDLEAQGSAHTQLGISKSKRGYSYTKGREFDENGKAIRDIEFTDHCRKDHPNPHQHRWLPNKTGGTLERGDAEPLDVTFKKFWKKP